MNNMLYNNAPVQPESKGGEIQSQLQYLEKSIYSLEELLDHLSTRLLPIRLQMPKDNDIAESGPIAMMCNVADNIQRYDNKIRSLIYIVSTLNDEIQL